MMERDRMVPRFKVVMVIFCLCSLTMVTVGVAGILTPISTRTLNWWMQYGEPFTLLHGAGYLACIDTRIPRSQCLADLTPEKLATLLPAKRETKIVIYGGLAPIDTRSPLIAYLEQAGYKNLYLLQGGLPAWKWAGYETESLARIPRVTIPSLAPTTVEDWQRRAPRALILDIRERTAFQEWHITGALNIPFTELHRRYLDIPWGHPLLVVDADGSQSLLAASYLARKGFRDLYRLRGGVKAWERAFSPLRR